MKVSFLLFISHCLLAQQWEEINSISLKQSPSSFATDFQGNIYLGFEDGKLSKYDAGGRLLENFSLPNNSSISLINVQNNLRPFLFYFDLQQITILDRFSSVPKTYFLSNYGLDVSMIACPSPDGDFWVVENNPMRLKKINPLREVTVLEVQISTGDSIRHMQAYQNILVLGDEKSIHIFDQFGGSIQTISFKKLNNFQIESGQIYVFTDEEIIIIDPFKGELQKRIAKSTKQKIMLKSKKQFLSFTKKGIALYDFKLDE